MLLFLQIICIKLVFILGIDSRGISRQHYPWVMKLCIEYYFGGERWQDIQPICTAGKQQQHDKDTNRRDHKSWDMSIFQTIHCSGFKQHDMMDAFHLLPQAYTSTQTPMHSFPFPHFLLFCISLHYFFTPCALRKSLACELRDIHHVERHPETQRESNICCCVRLLFSVWACGVLSNDCTIIIVWQSDIYPQTAFPAPAEEIWNIPNHTDRCNPSFTIHNSFAITHMHLDI